MQRWGFQLTFGGAQEILPAGPQQADESGGAGGDLLLQERTNPGADLQQVVCADVPVKFHLHARTHTQKTYLSFELGDGRVAGGGGMEGIVKEVIHFVV